MQFISLTFRLSPKLSFERAEVDSGCFSLLVCFSAGHSSDFVPWDIFEERPRTVKAITKSSTSRDMRFPLFFESNAGLVSPVYL